MLTNIGVTLQNSKISHHINRIISLQLPSHSASKFKALFKENIIVNLSAHTLNCCKELTNPCYKITIDGLTSTEMPSPAPVMCWWTKAAGDVLRTFSV